jgi:hypothetical protein
VWWRSMVGARVRCCSSCYWLVIVGGLRSILSLTMRLDLTSARAVLDVREEEALVLWRDSVEVSVGGR